MPLIKLPNDPEIPKRPRGPQNRTRRTNPAQETFKHEYRGFLQKYSNPPKTNLNPPRFIGVCRLEGKEYWISAWVGEFHHNGKKTLKLIFQAKEPPGEPGDEPYQFSLSDEPPF